MSKSTHTTLGSRNVIVGGRATSYEVTGFSAPLSVKSVVSGRARWQTASGEFELIPGSALIVNDDETYSMSIASLQPVETHCVFFARGFVDDACRAATTGSAALLDAPPAPAVEFHEPLLHGGSLVRALARTRGGGEDAFAGLATELAQLREDIRSRVARLPALRSTTRAELLRRVGKATEYLHGHIAEPVRLEEIAAAAALSPFHLHRIFTAFHGVTPHGYLTRLRLARARMLLRDGHVPVADVATACGFSSLTSFTSLFRRTFGVPPAAFRKIEEASVTPAG